MILRRHDGPDWRLAIEIAVALSVKVMLLVLLWAMFFSQPAGQSRKLSEERLAADLFGAPSATYPQSAQPAQPAQSMQSNQSTQSEARQPQDAHGPGH
jgi:hypothetical protein